MNKLIMFLNLKKKQSIKIASTSNTTNKPSLKELNKLTNKPPTKSSNVIVLTKSPSSKLSQPRTIAKSSQLADEENLVFNAQAKLNFYSFINSSLNSKKLHIVKKYKISNESFRSELISLEQMYNDNSTFNNNDMNNIYTDILDNDDSSCLDSNNSSNMSNNAQQNTSINRNSTLKSILKPTGYSQPSEQAIIQSVSIIKLEEEIRFKIATIKLYAINLDLDIPVNLLMLETMYDLKMGNLKQQARNSLEKFDKKSISDRQSRKGNNLNRFLLSTAKLLKNFNGKNHRTRSLNSIKRESPIKSCDVKHLNYFSFERDNLERFYENQMRSFQCEILLLINQIELQFKQLEKNLQEYPSANSRNVKIQYCNRHHQHHRRRISTDALTKKQRIQYSNETLLQKRIRNHKHCNTGGSIQNLSNIEIIEKNKNPFAVETMV